MKRWANYKWNVNMKRWTEQDKEWQGYRRKMANGMKVTLPDNPWDKNKEVDTQDGSKSNVHTDKD